jgi:hypothetical protein
VPDDFFDSDWEETGGTQETAVTRSDGETPPPPRSPRPPRPGRAPRRAPRLGSLSTVSLPPLEYRRLAILGAGILGVIALLIIFAQGCSGASAQSKNNAYMKTLITTALDPSARAAAAFHATLNSRRSSLPLLRKQLAGELATMQKAADAARAAKAPSQVAPFQPYLLQSLDYRVTGLRCMATNLTVAWRARGAVGSGGDLAPCVQRLLTSDVIYADSFSAPAVQALKGLGVQVPTSQFLRPADTDLATPAGIGAAIVRLKPAAVHGLHGLSLVSVVAEPQHLTLVPGSTQQNAVKGDSHLVFFVTAQNGGNFREVSVPVRLELKRPGATPIVKVVQIASIDKGATATVRFPGLFANSSSAPVYSKVYSLTVTVVRVPGEHNISNNTATYRVQFIIPG